jgi:hypothetical protein
MNRRTLLATALALTAPMQARANNARIELVYIGARECPYCTLWRRDEKPKLRASAMFRRLSYIEIEPRRIRDAYNPRYWPTRLQPILQTLPIKDGTPRFLILRDGALYANSLGDWQDVVPRLRHLTGTT